MSCIITRKSRASIRGKLHHCQTYMRHFSHRRKYTACSSRDSFAYSESRHDSYPQFPRSSLGTRGLQTRSHRKKKKTAFLESLSAKASSTNEYENGFLEPNKNFCVSLYIVYCLIKQSSKGFLVLSRLPWNETYYRPMKRRGGQSSNKTKDAMRKVIEV